MQVLDYHVLFFCRSKQVCLTSLLSAASFLTLKEKEKKNPSSHFYVVGTVELHM